MSECKPGIDERFCKLRQKFSELEKLRVEVGNKKEEIEKISESLDIHFYGDDDVAHKEKIMEEFFEKEVRKVNKNVKLRGYNDKLDLPRESEDKLRAAVDQLEFEKLFPEIRKFHGKEDEILERIAGEITYWEYKEGFVRKDKIKVSGRSDWDTFGNLSKLLNIMIDGEDPKTTESEMSNNVSFNPNAIKDKHIKAVTKFKDTADITLDNPILAKKVFIAMNYVERR